MSKKDAIKLGRQPPDEAALVMMFGVKLRLTRWGVGAVAAACCTLLTLLLVWMSPEQAIAIIKVISGH